MKIQNTSPYSTDHLQALIEACAKAVGGTLPDLFKIRRERCVKALTYDGVLTLRILPPNATPLEILGCNRFLKREDYMRLVLQLSTAVYHKIDITRFRSAFGLGPMNTRFYFQDAIASEEASKLEIPEWADLPLSAGAKGKESYNDKVRTLRTQIEVAEKEHSEGKINALRTKLIRYEELLAKPEKPEPKRRKKAEAAAG